MNPDPHRPDSHSPDSHSPDPRSPDPRSADPHSPDPRSPDPRSPDPHSPDPHSPEPRSPDRPLELITAPNLVRAGLVHGFSTRGGGVSSGPFRSLNLGFGLGDDDAAVSENLERLKRAAGAPECRWAMARQVHGAAVRRVQDSLELPFVGGDADVLVSDRAGWLIGVRTADCVPILLVGERAVAAVHAGWRGTVLNALGAAIACLSEQLGESIHQLQVAIGPSIGPKAYGVGLEVVQGLSAALAGAEGGIEGVILPPAAGDGAAVARADLQEANRRLALTAGIDPARISVLRHCVYADEARFFSHRRDSGQTGRMLSFVGLLSPGQE